MSGIVSMKEIWSSMNKELLKERKILIADVKVHQEIVKTE